MKRSNPLFAQTVIDELIASGRLATATAPQLARIAGRCDEVYDAAFRELLVAELTGAGKTAAYLDMLQQPGMTTGSAVVDVLGGDRLLAVASAAFQVACERLWLAGKRTA